jgi:hypothetical protein
MAPRGDNPAAEREEDARRAMFERENIDGIAAWPKRRDLMWHCPYGRALDAEHLAVLVESGTTENRGLVMRNKLVAWAVQQRASELILTRAELEQLEAAQQAGGPNWLTPASIPEWPPSR